jgi:hypothetical protein
MAPSIGFLFEEFELKKVDFDITDSTQSDSTQMTFLDCAIFAIHDGDDSHLTPLVP